MHHRRVPRSSNPCGNKCQLPDWSQYHWMDCDYVSVKIARLHVARTHIPSTGAFISLLVVHSLGRVVHRHEREAWIQQSAFRTRSIVQARDRQSRQSLATRTSRSARTSYSTGAWRPSISSKYRSLRERRNRSDPDAAQLLDQERFSWQFGSINPFQDPPTSPVSSPPLTPTGRNILRGSEQLDLGPLQSRRASWRSQDSGGKFVPINPGL